ncbi:hypothetical protein QVD17_09209 [Tagetes erecta]|uniref:Homeobox domain-containing protein n=1 Tax=Tagetes erecta TaxID=13708 RepID=A0AAD8KYX9_TARER|nr:hypothetical protein QVD17_09209 [Tagetes erecta]
MVNDVSCITSLNLSLGVHDFIPRNHRLDLQEHDRDQYQDQYQYQYQYPKQLEKKSMIKLDQPLPSLLLGLGRDQDPVNLIDQQNSYSIVSVVSSFSNSTCAKRGRDDSSEEVDKLLSRSISDIDRDEIDGGCRKKLRLTKEQSFVLEESFKQHSTLNPKEKQTLAKSLNLRPRQVEVWFQNRRARTKVKQNEVECELLKKCFEALTSDNIRLKREIQQLKEIKTRTLPTQFYMRFPATGSHTMCPSCETIISGGTAKSSKTL